MDAVSYSLASKQAQRIEKFIENPDSASGVLTVPKVIAAGETITIPAGRVAVLPNVQVDGTLNISGEVFIPSGATLGDLDAQLALKAPLVNPAFTNPTATTQAAQDNSTKVATTAYVDGKMVLGTAVNSTSGTSIDFTGIPSWAKRITVILNGISLSGSSIEMIQIGSGSVQTTGYKGAVWNASGSPITYTTGFRCVSSNLAADIKHITMTLIKIQGNTWVASLSGGYENSGAIAVGGGSVTLSGVLDRIRITTANGTDTFDSGQINIIYEG